jgi:hypothetical protein
LEWTRTRFEQSLAEFYTIPLEEHLQYLINVGGGNLFLILVSKTDQAYSMMFEAGDCVG